MSERRVEKYKLGRRYIYIYELVGYEWVLESDQRSHIKFKKTLIQTKLEVSLW
jgi:hypothetical protein